MSELKPCPFCGGTDLGQVHRTTQNYVSCHSCGARMTQSDVGYGDAQKLWNRRAQPAQAGQVLTGAEIKRIGGLSMDSPYFGIGFDLARAIEQAVLAKRVPTQQISDSEFTPDAKLMELADKIDHEQNWRHSGIFQDDHLTQDQKDRVLAGVMLRRYADLMAPESWRLFPPKSVVSHSYRAATLEAVVKMAERHGIVGEKGGA